MKFRLQLPRLCACVLLAAGPAFAQTPSPGASPNLSEKLDRSNGVVQPKEVDPGIEKPAPKADDPNVIPPPGTKGGEPAPQPK
jgi:hypothetical protein